MDITIDSSVNYDLLDPNYKPCECDLTVGICDLNCCCDTKCSESDKNAFSLKCQNELGGINKDEIDTWYCYDIYGNPQLNKLNWFPIICVEVSL
jgi:tectonic-2